MSLKKRFKKSSIFTGSSVQYKKEHIMERILIKLNKNKIIEGYKILSYSVGNTTFQTVWTQNKLFRYTIRKNKLIHEKLINNNCSLEECRALLTPEEWSDYGMALMDEVGLCDINDI